jgi:hypothetical protein
VAILNADWVIAHRGLLWDLNVWPDDVSNDDVSVTSAGLDYSMLVKLMSSSYSMLNGSSMIHVAGFVPWAFKYITEEHGGVATEWQAVKVLSAFNAFVDADACCHINTFANSAFYQHYPLPDKYVQNALPTVDELVAAGYVSSRTKKVKNLNYVSFYVGDYDSAAWVFNELPSKWLDVNRGTVPLGWAINPTIAVRFPPIFEMMYSSLTANDRITSGDSGAGYVNPTQLIEPRDMSGLPSATDLWIQHNQHWFGKFDLTFTGFLINGASGPMTTEAELMNNAFSPHGGTEQSGYSPTGKSPHLQNGVPFFAETDISGDVNEAAQTILTENDSSSSRPQFHVYRSILQTPTYHKKVVELVQSQASNVVFVDPVVLSMLASLAI